MAGTRGIAKVRGGQIQDATMRDINFDSANPLAENKVNINWANHKEALAATKVDVWVQVNNKDASGLNQIDVTSALSPGTIATGENVEGIVLERIVEVRKAGSADTPIFDADGDVVYGKLAHSTGVFTLKFYSTVGGVETAFTMPATTNVDFRYALRTNLSVLPKDAILNGGASFVEEAVDVKAFLNLTQLMKDLYGASGTLSNDGNAHLAKDLVTQISEEATARTNADKAIRDDIASSADGKGAELVGVQSDANYTGANAQEVLSNLASRTKWLEENGGAEVTATHTREAATANNYFAQKTGGDAFASLEARLNEIENVVDAQADFAHDAVNRLDSEDDEAVFEAVGGETQWLFTGGVKAKEKGCILFINGMAQAPGINMSRVLEGGTGYVLGFNFAPETLTAGDVCYAVFKKVI